MNYLNIEASQHEMRLVQLGAQVEQVNSKMCYIKFMIENIPVEYVYSLNKKNKFFLERIKPYPLPVRSYEKESQIVDVIEVDIKQFKNAVKSTQIENFVNINKEFNLIIKRFEDLFLYYNIPSEDVDLIKARVQAVEDAIFQAKEKSVRIFFEKEPENLK